MAKFSTSSSESSDSENEKIQEESSHSETSPPQTKSYSSDSSSSSSSSENEVGDQEKIPENEEDKTPVEPGDVGSLGRSSPELPVVLDTDSESDQEEDKIGEGSDPHHDKTRSSVSNRDDSSPVHENQEKDESSSSSNSSDKESDEKTESQDDVIAPGETGGETEHQGDPNDPRTARSVDQEQDNNSFDHNEQDDFSDQEEDLDPAQDSPHGENDVQDGESSSESSSSDSSSSSSSDSEDDGGPLVVRQNHDDANDGEGKETMALSLKKALEERERELERKRAEEEKDPSLGARKPSEPSSHEYMETPSPDAFDFTGDPSLRARTAFDFEEQPPELPPKLPPKQRPLAPIVAPNIGVHRVSHNPQPVPQKRSKSPQTVDVHPNIFHVNDKTDSLRRGMWSDEEEDVESFYPSTSSHPAPDRVIDFSNNPEGDHSLKRSRSRNKSSRKRSTSRRRSRSSRSRSPSASGSTHRVIDFGNNEKPYEVPLQDGINRQAMVSLHSNTYDTDAYDSVQETGDELNKLIEKANTLGIRHNYPAEHEDVFPKQKLKEKNLESKHQDAFAKIVKPIPTQVSPPTSFRPSQGPSADQLSSDNSRKSNRSTNSRKRRKAQAPIEAVDGDDEISIAESDINRFAPTSPLAIREQASLPFLTAEVYPSDYTEFESYSEAEILEPKVPTPDRSSSFSSEDIVQEPYHKTMQTGGESAYDTVADNDLETDNDFMPKAKLNPIVNSKFQICSDLSGSKSKSFPARLREGKPKKERPSLGHIAIPLQKAPKRKAVYPSSLPYFANEFDDEDDFEDLRRTGSYDDIRLGLQTIGPQSIVVHRQPTYPSGYRPEIMPEILVQSSAPPPLPEKKEKKKKDKKNKETSEKSVPKIHLSVEGENNENLNNNLQINLLPSNDPNVINLNIRSTSTNQTGPQSLPVLSSAQPNFYSSEPMSLRPQISVNNPGNTVRTTTAPVVVQSDNQHRVVEINAPPMVVTGDEVQSQPVYPTNGGVLMAGGVATEILPNPVLTAATQQFAQTTNQPQSLPYPTISLGPQPVVPAPLVQSSQSVPPQPSVDNPIAPPTLVQQPPLQPNNEPTVVDIHRPMALPEDRSSSLPNSLRHSTGSGRMHHGDSGIDLSVHDRSRKPPSRNSKGRRMKRSASRSSRSSRHRDMTSSSDSEPRRRRSSMKRLKSHDYLANAGPSQEYLDWYQSEHLKPSCCYLFMKHVLFVINLIFAIVGLALIGLGIWGLTALYSNGITDATIIFKDPLFMVLILGFVVTLVAFNGAAGFVRDNICMLKTFGSLLVFLFIVFVAGGIVFWVLLDDVKDFTTSTFKHLIEQYDWETREGLAFSFDFLQSSFKCCGAEKPGSAHWSKNKNFRCVQDRCPLPLSCCMDGVTQDPSFTCLASSDMVHKKSCVAQLSHAVADYEAIIVGVWVGIWAIMMLQLVFIYFMCKEIQYLQKIRDFIANPMKLIKTRMDRFNRIESEYSESSEEESSSNCTSSDEEYIRRKRRKQRKRTAEKKENKRGMKKTTSRNGRRGSYQVNRAFSIQDERSSRRKRSRKGSRSRSRSRSRRGSF